MLRSLLPACVCAAAICSAAGAAPRQEAPTSPLSITKITAAFVPNDFATHYTIGDPVDLGKKVTITWTLELTLVDAPGAQAPGEGPPGATVDETCNNHGTLKQVGGTEFTWKHGEQDGCDHGKMGPQGHQGIVTVVVQEVGGPWSCEAEYKGTNSASGPAPTCSEKSTGGHPYLNGVLTRLAALDTGLDDAIAGAQGNKLTTDQLGSLAFHLDHELSYVLQGSGSQGMNSLHELAFADSQLNGVGKNEDLTGHSDAGDFFGGAAGLHGAAKFFSGATAKELNDLGDQATDLEHQLDKKQKTPAEAKAAAQELIKKKKAIIVGLPKMYGMRPWTLYTKYEQLYITLGAAYDKAHESLSAGASALKTARTAKKAFEAMIAKADR